MPSAVEAKHSEVLKDSQTTISCKVTGLTKRLDAVTWEKPDSGGVVITDGTDGYQIDVGTYQGESNSQTTILTIPAAENQADAVFSCVITSNEHGKSDEKTAVNSNVFSKYSRHLFQNPEVRQHFRAEKIFFITILQSLAQMKRLSWLRVVKCSKL